MLKTSLIALLLASALAAGGSPPRKAPHAAADTKPAVELNLPDKDRRQVLCPVMELAVDHEQFTDHDGYRVSFCCSSCPAVFRREPATFMARLKEWGVAPERADASAYESYIQHTYRG